MIALRVAALWPLWLTGLGGVLAVVAIGAQVGGTQRRRARRYARLSARHVLGDVVGYGPAPVYGSMNRGTRNTRFLTTPTHLQAEYEAIMRRNGLGWREPSEAEVAASRAAHGYIPELDTDLEVMRDEPATSAELPVQDMPGRPLVSSGPGVVPETSPGPDPLPIRGDAQGWDVRVCAGDSRPAARADLTGSLSSRPPEEDPAPVARAGAGLGPRAQAVLDRYQARHRERWGFTARQEIGVLA